MSEYIIHKAVELGKVKAKRRAELSAPGYLEENFIAQPKFDGCNMVLYIYTDDNDERRVISYSRTGEIVRSVEHIEYAAACLPGLADGAYLGEAWCPDAPFSDISGWFRRQQPDEDTCRLQFAVFDALTVEEWLRGYSDVPYEQRALRCAALTHIPQGRAPLWSAGSFGKIAEQWNNTTAQDVCNKLVEAGGYDGLILRDPQGAWKQGDRGTNGEIIKIKRKLSFDLEVVDWEWGKGKHINRMGALIVNFKGKPLRVGTGFTDKERDPDFANDMLGHIIEIEAMDYSSEGLLREPRFKGIRYDKTEPDT